MEAVSCQRRNDDNTMTITELGKKRPALVHQAVLLGPEENKLSYGTVHNIQVTYTVQYLQTK